MTANTGSTDDETTESGSDERIAGVVVTVCTAGAFLASIMLAAVAFSAFFFVQAFGLAATAAAAALVALGAGLAGLGVKSLLSGEETVFRAAVFFSSAVVPLALATVDPWAVVALDPAALRRVGVAGLAIVATWLFFWTDEVTTRRG